MKSLGAADPTAIASYRLIGVLGSGGMGRVYLAQSATGRRLAIKVIRADLADNPVFRRRFAHEVAAVRAVNPLFTAAVVDADTEAEAPWLATTFIDGPSLEQWVGEHGPLTPEAVLTLAAGLAEALASIHHAGLVHRDLKPGNVLLDDSGPHIIDFGIAQTPDSTRMTTSLVGTPSYMAPERLRGAEAAPPADVFSLGATLAFAATGRRLADGDSMYEQVLQMTAGRFDLSTVPAGVRRMVARCVSRKARDRPSAAELTRVLSAMPELRAPRPGWYRSAGSVRPVRPEPTTVRLPRRRAIALGGAIGAVIVGGGAAALFAPLSGRAPHASADSRDGAPAPGSVLWQLKSGAAPPSPPPQDGTWTVTARIAVDPAEWAVTSTASSVFAVGTRGERRWAVALAGGPFDVRLWGDGVLVNDARRVWLLDSGTGRPRFSALDLAGAEATVRGVAPDRVRIRQVALLPDRAFLDLSGTTVAIDRTGRQLWRAPALSPGTAQPSFTALAITGTRLVAADRSGSTVRVSAYDAGTGGAAQWSHPYDLPAMPDQQPPPPPPGYGPPPTGYPTPGAPFSGSPRGGDQGLPPPDSTRERSELRLGKDFLALRNSESIQVLRVADGGLVWKDVWSTPVAGIQIVGDQLLVAADTLTARSLATGASVWQKNLRGARLGASSDGHSTVAVTDQDISMLNASGTAQWRASLPRTATDQVPDQLTVQGQVGYLTLQPRGPHTGSLDVDVLAVWLGGPG
jgi:predicted Ser/Thr protein kinase/outer membrane protein assembly factor BamB